MSSCLNYSYDNNYRDFKPPFLSTSKQAPRELLPPFFETVPAVFKGFTVNLYREGDKGEVTRAPESQKFYDSVFRALDIMLF